MLMGDRADGLVCADLVGRTLIGLSRNVHSSLWGAQFHAYQVESCLVDRFHVHQRESELVDTFHVHKAKSRLADTFMSNKQNLA